MKQWISKKDVSVTRVPHSGYLILTALIGGYLVSKTYIGYSVKEAMSLFLAEA